MFGIILVILIVLAGALPKWGHSRGWGYYPSGGPGVLLIIVVIWMLIVRIQ